MISLSKISPLSKKVEDEREPSKRLPMVTQSLCPECLSVINALIFEKDDKIFMEKTCDLHGFFRDLISSDAKFFKLMLERDYSSSNPVTNPMESKNKTCPNNCGICEEHLSSPIMINIDLTNRCNLSCPICFANADASGRLLELSIDQVRHMLDTALSTHEVQPICLQYTGGEPTVHPHFLEALREAGKRSFTQVQIATNGIKFAHDPEFAFQASEAGLNTAYLQFDGMDDQIYRKSRGRNLIDLKLKAIDNLAKAQIRTVLVPTIVKGLNDKHIGKILKYALKNVDKIAGISWQPVAFTGRIDAKQRMEQRFTIADLARELQEQTGIVQMYRDWYPYGFVEPFNKLLEAINGQTQVAFSCNPVCGVGTYLVVNLQTEQALPVPAFADVEPLMKKIITLTESINSRHLFSSLTVANKFRKLKQFYHQDKGPEGWKFNDFIEFMMDFAEFRHRFPDNEARLKTIGNTPFRSFLMASMHFQDVYNYQIDRVKRCVIHYAAPDGRIYPFCTYNSGPYHRERIEREYSVPVKKGAKAALQFAVE
jgi:uncharacterized radical SAM superfamily Fe-S cluster-containing enzyme